jgi:hypothetical protein
MTQSGHYARSLGGNYCKNLRHGCCIRLHIAK